MSVDSRLSGSSAATSDIQSFGSASLRLFAPQMIFDVVRRQTASPYYGAGVELRWPGSTPPQAANQNQQPPRTSAA